MFGNKNDDLKLFNNIYHKYKDIINYWIATRVKEKSHHEDIFQEVLLKLYTHVREYDISKGNLKNWIYTVTTSCIRDYYKTYINKEGKNYIDDLSVLRDETYDEHTKMRDIKHILSSYEYDIFVCYFIIGMTKKNISKMFNIPYHNCKTIIKEIHEKLKVYYKEK